VAGNVKKEQIQEAQKTLDLNTKEYGVELTTSMGPIRLTFFPEVAPGHVKNFVALAKSGFYNELTFHRVIDGFMIQGGCPHGSGTGDAGYKIKAEFSKTPHEDGVLSMARSSDPDSAGTQFFICIGSQNFLDNKYTAFGKTADVESLTTVHKIGKVKKDPNNKEKPLDKVTITKATVTEKAK